MKFLQPDYFYYLLFIPALVFLIFFSEKLNSRKKSLLFKKVAPKNKILQVSLSGFFLVFGTILIIFALARPQKPLGNELREYPSIDLMITLDVSQSMLSEDTPPSRIKVAKKKIIDLLNSLAGDRVGLVAFAGSAFLASPMTQDYLVVQDFLESLSPDSISTQGTNLKEALKRSEIALIESKTLSGAVILITDAEDHGEEAFDQAKELKDKGYFLYTIGVGTENGGRIPVRDEYGRFLRFKKDRSGKEIISKLNPAYLKKLAEQGGGKSYLSGGNTGNLSFILKDIEKLERRRVTERRVRSFEELYQWFLAPGVLFLFLSLVFSPSGIPITFKFLLLFSCLCVQNSSAEPDFRELNKKGLESYESQKYKESEDFYLKALEKLDLKNKDKYEQIIRLNLGLSKLRLNKTEEALKELDAAARGPNSEVRADAQFNKGLAQKITKDLAGARDSFINTIQELRKSKNDALKEKAREQLKHIVQEMKQNKKQQSENEKKDKQDQKSGSGENQNKNQDKEEENKEKNKEQDKQNENQNKGKKNPPQKSPQKPQFQSKKLSKKQAENMLNQLRDKDKELFQKFGRKRSNGSPAYGKDW